MPTFVLTLTASQSVATAIADELADGTRINADAAGAFDLGNGSWGLEAYFPESIDPTRLVDALLDAFGSRPDVSAEDLLAAFAGFSLRQLDGGDWTGLELDRLPPIKAGRYRVFGEHNRPSDEKLGRFDLVIEASTAFGTGDHASTALALEALDAVLKRQRPRRILDVGTGTGILALAAARGLPGCKILATDIAPVAIEMAGVNAFGNGLNGCLRIVSADGLSHRAVREAAPFDLVLANILPDPLTRLANDIIRAMKSGAVLIIAGLRQGEEARMVSAYGQRGLVFRGRRRAKEWSSLIFAKP